MARIEKLKELNFQQLRAVRDEVQAAVVRMRANFENIPTVKFNKFNSLLGILNTELEKRIENEYLE